MSDTTLRYYDFTMAYIPNKSMRRVQHARKMLRLHTSRRRFKQSVRTILSKVI
ncbi:MAG: hypothetical protein AAB865_01925 [Patescibacteria group bacterium]